MHTKRLLAAVLTIPILASAGENIAVNWSSRTISCPSELGYERSIPVRVTNLNRLIYAYEAHVSVSSAWADDYSNLKSALTQEAGDHCNKARAKAINALSTIASKLDELTKPKLLSSKKYESIKLEDTIAGWNAIEASDQFRHFPETLKAFDQEAGTSDCSALPGFADDVRKAHEGWDEIVEFQKHVPGPHEWNGEARLTVGANNTITVSVREDYKGTTENGQKDFTCEIKSGILSLSAGPLFSSLPNRNYKVVDVPKVGTDGKTLNETYKALAVENGKPVGLNATALLNFAIPKMDWYGFSFHASSGPVLRFNNKDDTSAFGYFAGISVSLAKRLFVTFGAQRSQFADFPVGYSQNSAVPTSIGTTLPQPVPRWTTRPAFAITYRTASFQPAGNKDANVAAGRNPAGGSGGNANPKPAVGKPADPPPPAPAPAPPPSGAGSQTPSSRGNPTSQPTPPKPPALPPGPPQAANPMVFSREWAKPPSDGRTPSVVLARRVGVRDLGGYSEGSVQSYYTFSPSFSRGCTKLTVLFENLITRSAAAKSGSASCAKSVDSNISPGFRVLRRGVDYHWFRDGDERPAGQPGQELLATLDSLDFDLHNPRHFEIQQCEGGR